MWHELGRRKKAAWPRMEQGEYRSFRAVHPFDERFDVETSGLIYELPSGHQHDLYNNGYFAVAPSVFHAVMRAMLEQLHLDLQRFRFVDLGSGKGRALMLAFDYPFHEIIGVELSPELDSIAHLSSRYRGMDRAARAKLPCPATCVVGTYPIAAVRCFAVDNGSEKPGAARDTKV